MLLSWVLYERLRPWWWWWFPPLLSAFVAASVAFFLAFAANFGSSSGWTVLAYSLAALVVVLGGGLSYVLWKSRAVHSFPDCVCQSSCGTHRGRGGRRVDETAATARWWENPGSLGEVIHNAQAQFIQQRCLRKCYA